VRSARPVKIRRIATRIKICGLTRGSDALLSARLGADYLGVVLAESPRRVRVAEARSWVAEVRAEFPHSHWVGVFVRPSAAELEDAVRALNLDLVQIHGLGTGVVPGMPVPAMPVPAMQVPGMPVPAVPVPAMQVPASPVPVVRAVAAAEIPALRAAGGDPTVWALLIDRAAGGGTGEAFDWSPLKGWREWLGERAPGADPPRLFLAGGLGPDNVADAIRAVRPFAVDASSRLEASPGCKDPEKIRAFIAAARGARRGVKGAVRGLPGQAQGRESEN